MTTKNETIKKLADLIEKNPECTFEIDNDCWYISGKNGNEIADNEKFPTDTRWYGSGNCYGAALAEALVELLNRRGFKITAEAV